jgi:serine/threonine-protein kinase
VRDARVNEPHREPSAGDVLGRYELLFPIASGGMATVYAARVAGEHGFQKPVALKLMLPHLARDERFVRMFLDEATLAARVVSPNVVSTLDLGREGETLYMVMELVIGPSLRELLGVVAETSERLPVRVAGAIALQIVRGLADAHEARGTNGEPLHLVHRDVSPHNVLVGVDGRVRLGDFGVALAVERHARTETGEVKGKLAYFSPEQLEGEPLDQRSDVFSAAAVAWECFVGRRLFGAANPLALAAEVAYGEIARVDVERPEVPREVADVIAAALEREPAQRTESAQKLARHLADALAATCGLAEPAEIGELARRWTNESVSTLEARLSVAMSLPTPRWDERSGLRPAVRPPRRAPVAIAITALALVAGAGLGWHVARPSGASREVGASAVGTSAVGTSAVGTSAAPVEAAAADDALAAPPAATNAPDEEPRVEAVEGAERDEGDDRVGARAPNEAEAAPVPDAPAELAPAPDDEPASRRRRRRPPRAVAPDEPRPEPTRPSLLLDVDAFDAQRRR